MLILILTSTLIVFFMLAAWAGGGGSGSADTVDTTDTEEVVDETGAYLDASQNTYELTFAAGELPPVDAFWSLALYGLDANLVDNAIDRYSIGDRSPNLKHNADVSLTLYLQYDSPGKDRESNWLPAPDGRFAVTLRAYRPREEITRGEWVPPDLRTRNK